MKKIGVIFFAFLSIIVVFVTHIQPAIIFGQKIDPVYYEIDLQVDQLHSAQDLFFYRTSVTNEELVIETANKIINKESISLMSGLPKTEFKGYDYPYGLSTVQLYYNSLRLISLLTDAYYVTSDTIYLDEAISIYKDWREQDKRGSIKNKYAWYDHSAANRTLTLTYLLRAGNYAIEREVREDIIDSLVAHGNWLFDDKYYQGKGNHGVMQDRALLQLGVFFTNQVYIKKAEDRLKQAFRRDFSAEGVHYENSVDYHKMMYKMYQDIFLLGGARSAAELELLEKSEAYLQFLKKPNGEFPLEGDSGLGRAGIASKNFHNFYDFESGKVIMQDEDLNNTEKSTYLFFKSGYVSAVHKHFDDLSFVLTDNGNNIFIDAGKYNYEAKDVFRKYIISPKAHTTVYLENQKYAFFPYTLSKYHAELTHYEENSEYIYAQGIIHIGKEILTRDIIYMEGVVFLLDRGLLSSPQALKQNFNLSPDVSISLLEANILTIKNSDKLVTLKQYYEISGVETFYEDRENVRGFYSTTFNSLLPMYQIEFSSPISKTPILLTGINTDTHNISVTSVNYDSNTSVFSAKVNGEILELRVVDPKL